MHTQPPGLLPCGLAPAVRAGQVCLHGATAEDGPGRPSQQDKSPRRHRLILGRSVQKHPVHKGNRSPA